MLCTERCFARRPGSGSGSRPCCFARTSSQCAGMITKKTFAAMIVPSIAPTWRKDARAAKSSPAANAESVTSTATATATSRSSRSTRQAAS